jgi:hypothetical protein
MKQGDKIRVLQMEDQNGMDVQATKMNGNTYTIDYIDGAGQIHLKESGLAIIPEVDKYVVFSKGEDDSIRDYDRELLVIYDVVSDYIRINGYVEDGDGLYLTENYEVFEMPLRAIRKGSEGTFFPMKALIRETRIGLYPNMDAIEQMVSLYTE